MIEVRVHRAADGWHVDIGCDGGPVLFDSADAALDCALAWTTHDANAVIVPGPRAIDRAMARLYEARRQRDEEAS